jgi:L-alanine-DL-glutamate epimerase-like enolase superfamily enzyme
MSPRPDAPIEGLDVSAYQVPTDEPESDGTLEWDSTTIVVVQARAAGVTGLGYTYADRSTAALIESKLTSVVQRRDVMDLAAIWVDMGAAIRNAGRPGAGMMAVSAVDMALWDLKGRILGLSVADLVNAAHEAVPVYGSGGFTSYSMDRLQEQLGGWVEQGIPRVKMKTSRDPGRDPERLDAARKAVGDQVALYVDANGALDRKQALYWAERFRFDWNVSWFEEPVSSADFEGLRLLRDRGPAGLDIAAGEYGYVLADFRNLLDAGAVDCLQADVTRCGGITGLMRVSGLCDAHNIDLSAHCAPAASAHAFCAAVRLRHLEYFHDHVRVESLLFDGTLQPSGGSLRPDRSRPGIGLELKGSDAERFRIAT